MSEAIMQLSAIKRSYQTGAGSIEVLRGLDLELIAGKVVGLVGPSGSGKSSLLHIAGLLERPDSGTIVLEGRNTASMSERERTFIRRKRLGFVYQFHHLLPELSAWENVAMPVMIAGMGRREARARASELLASMELEARLEHRPGALSGGEQQRVAIARALANRPALVLADEPTGNLDPDNSQNVLSLLFEAARSDGVAVLAATHNLELTKHLDSVHALHGGVLTELDQG